MPRWRRCSRPDITGAASVSRNVMRKPRHWVKLLLSLAACTLVQGCAGGFVARTKTKTFIPPSIREKPNIDAIGANGVTNLATADWLRKHWGRPRVITPASTESDVEVWTYRFGWAWCGLVPWVVVPVPLVAPVQRQKIVFHICDQKVIRADVVRSDLVGTLEGIHR